MLYSYKRDHPELSAMDEYHGWMEDLTMHEREMVFRYDLVSFARIRYLNIKFTKKAPPKSKFIIVGEYPI